MTQNQGKSISGCKLVFTPCTGKPRVQQPSKTGLTDQNPKSHMQILRAGISPCPTAVNVCCVHARSLQKQKTGMERQFCPHFMNKWETPLKNMKKTLHTASPKHQNNLESCQGKNMLIVTSNIYLLICKHTHIRYSLKCIFSGIKTTQLATFWARKVLFRSVLIKALSSPLHLCIIQGHHSKPDKTGTCGPSWLRAALCSALSSFPIGLVQSLPETSI